MFGKDLIEKINKIISNMILTIASAVAEVEQMSILLNQMEKEMLLTIKISNERRPLSRSLADKLSKKNDTNLNTNDIVVYMTSLLLEQYKAEVNCICASNYIDIGIKL